ncbi:MAG: hypothetical protein FWD73_10685, partial [Polyangiaceae bacterium]|nr:hypothetical protein [Polyangiaceae bacterium]
PRACDTRIGHDRQDCDEPFGEHSCPHHKSGKTAKLDALALGAPGTLDTSFGSGGVYEDTTEYGYIRTVAPQSDGKTLIGAQSTDGATSVVIRLKADGSVDPMPADSSIQKIDGQILGMTAYPDGRIVTATRDTISRYTAAGPLDTTFPSPPIPANWTSFTPHAFVVGQNDSIYAGGQASVSNTTPSALLQIQANWQAGCSGSWDNTNYPSITKLSLLPTGALAFAGNTSVGVGVGRSQKSPSSCALDTTYGVWSSTDWTYLGDAWFETDGSVDLLVGKGAYPYVYSIVRINKDGELEAKVDLPLDSYYYGITRAPDGRYLVAGHQSTASNDSMAVAYYNFDLTPDMSIGKQGVITIPVSTVLTNPLGSSLAGVGWRALYTPDSSQTVVVGSIRGLSAVSPLVVDHLVVARIWN